MSATRVVLAEDQPMVRAGFRALLDSREDIDVVGEAATGTEAVELVLKQAQDSDGWASKARECSVLQGFGPRGWMGRVGLK